MPKFAGLRVAESTVERTTEAAGRDLGDRLAEGEVFGTPRDWAWHKDAEGKTCADVALDATGVDQQGEHAGRRPRGWCTVAMVYSPVPEAQGRRAAPDGPRRRGSMSATWPVPTAWPRWGDRCDVRRLRSGWIGPSDGSSA